MVHIIVDDIMYDIENTRRKKVEKRVNKAILTTAFAIGVQLGVGFVNYSGKAILVIKNVWKKISNSFSKKF